MLDNKSSGETFITSSSSSFIVPYSKYDAQGLILMSGRVNPHEVLDFPGQVLDLPDEELPLPH